MFCDATAAHCEDSALPSTAEMTPAGIATYKFRPGIGSHSYQAIFVGTNSYAKSASAATSLQVTGLYPATIAIAASGAPGDYALTATVVGSGSHTFPPTGYVSFLDTTDDNAFLGTAPLETATPGESFLTAFPSIVGESPNWVAMGDFNGDGSPEITRGKVRKTPSWSPILCCRYADLLLQIHVRRVTW
jgi:hypothetical protein